MIYLFILLLTILLVWASQTGKEIKIASIQGLMFGALYDCEEDEGEKYYTVQVLLGVISINIYW